MRFVQLVNETLHQLKAGDQSTTASSNLAQHSMLLCKRGANSMSRYSRHRQGTQIDTWDASRYCWGTAAHLQPPLIQVGLCWDAQERHATCTEARAGRRRQPHTSGTAPLTAACLAGGAIIRTAAGIKHDIMSQHCQAMSQPQRQASHLMASDSSLTQDTGAKRTHCHT
jgi:hypothetical protein